MRRHNKSKKPFGYPKDISERILGRTFSDFGARVYTTLYLIFEMFLGFLKSMFRILPIFRISFRKLYGFVLTPRLASSCGYENIKGYHKGVKACMSLQIANVQIVSVFKHTRSCAVYNV